jgi:phosphoglycerol transferase MdoB-like AlkP superfamily enzyme
LPFYGSDAAGFLAGGVASNGEAYPHWYLITFVCLLFSVGIIFLLQYKLLDSPRRVTKLHWWMYGAILMSVNFLCALLPTVSAFHADNYDTEIYTMLTVPDLVAFALSNALWSIILYAVLTSIPVVRTISVNGRNTTFWKP